LFTWFKNCFVYMIYKLLCILDLQTALYTWFTNWFVYLIYKLLCILDLQTDLYTWFTNWFVYMICKLLCIHDLQYTYIYKIFKRYVSTKIVLKTIYLCFLYSIMLQHFKFNLRFFYLLPIAIFSRPTSLLLLLIFKLTSWWFGLPLTQ
jgi:hypothetical protein